MNIRERREAAGITQRQLAERIGVTQSAVQKWENGSQFPKADKLPAIAKVLHCTVDALLGVDDTPIAIDGSAVADLVTEAVSATIRDSL